LGAVEQSQPKGRPAGRRPQSAARPYPLKKALSSYDSAFSLAIFRIKCYYFSYGKLKFKFEFSSFVSHNLGTIESKCFTSIFYMV
uniref:hypothetical protein n=1 Tax=Megasphaera elsdenii TaxID=907 RepID=UPI003FEF400D